MCLRNNSTGSKSNHPDATVILNLIRDLITIDSLPNSLAIDTPYAEQRNLYPKRLLTLSDELNLNLKSGIRFATIDAMQGQEADYVFLNWVVTNPGGLGFTVETPPLISLSPAQGDVLSVRRRR